MLVELSKTIRKTVADPAEANHHAKTAAKIEITMTKGIKRYRLVFFP
jgi:hypothetical protein